MSNVLCAAKVEQIGSLILSGSSIRETARAASVSTATVKRYRPIIVQTVAHAICCQCGQPAGHRGWCSVRYSESASRQAWMARWQASRPRAAPRVKPKPFRMLSYPFIPNEGTRSPGAELVLLVNRAVPRDMPEQDRADICQELLLGLLSGEIDASALPTSVRPYAARVRRRMRDYGVSLNQPRADGTTLADVIAAQEGDADCAGGWLRIQ